MAAGKRGKRGNAADHFGNGEFPGNGGSNGGGHPNSGGGNDSEGDPDVYPGKGNEHRSGKSKGKNQGQD